MRGFKWPWVRRERLVEATERWKFWQKEATRESEKAWGLRAALADCETQGRHLWDALRKNVTVNFMSVLPNIRVVRLGPTELLRPGEWGSPETFIVRLEASRAAVEMHVGKEIGEAMRIDVLREYITEQLVHKYTQHCREEVIKQLGQLKETHD